MAFIRYLLTMAVCLFVYANNATAQTVYYPAGQSQLLRSTAEDMAMLLQKAIPGSHFTTAQYGASVPISGVILIYDSAVSINQTCRVKSNGSNFISFSAGQDNGLCYGVYEYLNQLGFKFYQPGSIWEITPTLASPYMNTDTVYSGRFKYKNWFISGGCNTWVMDKNTSYYWDTYYGEFGHQWALYQRRNNMVGGYRFAGHRDDIFTSNYLSTLQNNNCYVAPYNGSRLPTRQSVPDINNTAAMQLWSSSIETTHTQFRNNIFNNRNVYANYFRNFNYAYGSIGIEVPDGAHWANSTLNDCSGGSFPKESDQHFALANYTAGKINAIYPGIRFQVYAYDGHVDVPSASVTINSNIDVQVVPTAFQYETSSKGILNRWYNRYGNISEYHYLNLAQWSGETPSFYLDDLKQTVQRLKEKNSQGIVWESAATKFASLPFLLAANTSLKNDKRIDDELKSFCHLFEGASATIYKLLQYWSDDKTVTVYNGLQDNKYKLPFYFKLVKQAETETQNASPVVKQRINELKAYLHYMVLYYDWVFDQEPVNAKAEKAEKLCLYLARISRLQIVNSSVLINNVIQQYQSTDAIYGKFNITNGTAYLDGLLPGVTDAETAAFFNEDYAAQTSIINNYSFLNATEIKQQFESNNMEPLEKINVQVGFTNGKDYTAKTEYYLLADKPGSFTIKYTPRFDMEGKGYMNITVEAVDKTLGIIKDVSLSRNSGPGILHINLPEAGTYKLSINSKYKSSAAITITTNGNYFYKNGPFFGSSIENYRGDLLSLPGWFYVPAGIDKVFFSINNSNPAGAGFATPADISKAFAFRNELGEAVEPQLINTSDSALFYIDVPHNSAGVFYKAFKMEQYRLCFANINNVQWYARKKNCTANDFNALIKPGTEQCITQLKAASPTSNLVWDVYDGGQWNQYRNTAMVELPATVSPNAIVTLKTGAGCIITKRMGDEASYLQQKTTCATGATAVSTDTKVIIFPNPGTGLFKCTQNGEPVIAEEISVFNASGLRVAAFSNTQQFNITSLPAGMYFYTLIINKVAYKGKLVKM